MFSSNRSNFSEYCATLYVAFDRAYLFACMLVDFKYHRFHRKCTWGQSFDCNYEYKQWSRTRWYQLWIPQKWMWYALKQPIGIYVSSLRDLKLCTFSNNQQFCCKRSFLPNLLRHPFVDRLILIIKWTLENEKVLVKRSDCHKTQRNRNKQNMQKLTCQPTATSNHLFNPFHITSTSRSNWKHCNHHNITGRRKR